MFTLLPLYFRFEQNVYMNNIVPLANTETNHMQSRAVQTGVFKAIS